MAQADFDFTGSVFTGGTDGQERLHSALGSPLTGWGDYCREYVEAGGGGGNNNTAHIKSSVEGGAYYQIPSTKAVSVRAFVRRATQTSPGANAIGVCAKAQSGATPVGYYMTYGDGSINNTGLYLRHSGAGWDQTVLASGLALNTWHRLRMDVVPVGSQDDVTIFTATAGAPDTWIERVAFSINSGQAGYKAWGSASYPRVGYTLEVYGGFNPTAYIDGFQVLVKDV